MKKDYNKQAVDFIAKTGIKIKKTFKKNDLYFQDDTQTRDIWNIRLIKPDCSFSFTFGQSIAEEGKEPDDYTILACLSSDSFIPDNFSDFCEEFGYDEDSRKAEKAFKSCCRQNIKIHGFFTEDEIEKLQEIS